MVQLEYLSSTILTYYNFEFYLKWNVCAQIKNNEITLIHFLMALSHNIRKQCF